MADLLDTSTLDILVTYPVMSILTDGNFGIGLCPTTYNTEKSLQGLPIAGASWASNSNQDSQAPQL
jgi:hypothetical protein